MKPVVRQAHPWHGIDVIEADIPRNCPAIIEVPKGSKCKYELDKASGLLMLDRMLHGSMHYEFNYGFIPQTYCDDGDPLDVCVFSSEPVDPLTLLSFRPLSVMRMRDEKGIDDKIIAVCCDDPAYGHVHKLSDLAPYRIEALRNFFERYKDMEQKEVVVDDFLPQQEAIETIHEALAFYQQNLDKLVGTATAGVH